jgi:hypothetical protein
MIWFIKIIGEDYKSQRIKIEYLPFDEVVELTGEFKTGGNWVEFCSITMSASEPSIEMIREKMEDLVKQLQKRIEQHQNLDKGFSVWKEIEYLED